MIICLSGPSGVGKTTIARQLVEHSGWSTLSTYTTRPARRGETEKISVPCAQFDAMQKNDEFFCIDNFYGNDYGIKKDDVESADSSNDFWVIDRPIWALAPFSQHLALVALILPETETQLVQQMETGARQERALGSLQDYRDNYHCFTDEAERSNWPQNVIVVVNRSEQSRDSAMLILEWAQRNCQWARRCR